LRDLARRLNNLPIFDLERWPARELMARTVGAGANALVVVSRLLQLQRFPGLIDDVAWIKPLYAALAFLPAMLLPAAFDLQASYANLGYSLAEIRLVWSLRLTYALLEAAVFLIYMLAFLVRRPPVSVARGFMETGFPMIMAVLPASIVMGPYTLGDWFPRHTPAYLWALCVLTLMLITGTVLNLTALFVLRKSFTIVSEARALVVRGPYRHVRHPVYSAHFLIFMCHTLMHWSPLAAVVYVGWACLVVVRARIEEAKLAAAFPQYEAYRQTTGMFFPRL